MKKALWACLCGMVLVGFPATAEAFVSWTNASGTTAYFDWANGGSVNGLYGDPTVMNGNTFVFFPSNFRAESSDGGTNTVYDRLEFDLLFHQGYCISGLKVTEYGDYGLLGTGASANASGFVSVENLSNSQIISETIVMNPSFPLSVGSGNWNGVADISDLLCDYVKISVENELIAISSEGSTAFIQKKVAGSAISITIIPEPATLALLGLGGLLLRRKR